MKGKRHLIETVCHLREAVLAEILEDLYFAQELKQLGVSLHAETLRDELEDGSVEYPHRAVGER